MAYENSIRAWTRLIFQGDFWFIDGSVHIIIIDGSEWRTFFGTSISFARLINGKSKNEEKCVYV